MLVIDRIVFLAALASGFNPGTGRVEIATEDAVTFDDESSIDRLGNGDVLGGGLGPVGNARDAFVRNANEALEGSGYLKLDGRFLGAVIGLDRIATRHQNGRVSFTLWERRRGSQAIVDILYASTVPGGDPNSLVLSRGVRLHPTGRATDDGWIELSTGDVDFVGHDQYRARAIRIMNVRVLEEALYGFPSNDDGAVWIDGLEIYERGPRAVPDVACRVTNEERICGVEGACVMGRCVDAATFLGNPPRDLNVRNDYLQRSIHRMSYIVGGRYSRDRVSTFDNRMSALAGTPSIANYWDEYRAAYDGFGDGHISAPLDAWPEPLFGDSVCLVESEADLLTGAPIRPMVYERDPNHPLGGQFLEGDVVLRVDGRVPADWLPLVDRHLRYAGDPRGRTFITTSQLLQAALMVGAELEIARCPVGVECRAPNVFTIDLAQTAAPFWRNGPQGWFDADLECDFRFRREVGGDFRDTEFVGHSDRDGIRTVLINGVSGDGRWMRGAEQAMQNVPSLVVLDERTGGGGTFDGVDAILSPFVGPNENPIADLVPQLSPEIDMRTHSVLRQCNVGWSIECGFFAAMPMAQGPRRATQPNARIAILNGLDVSGNDFLPRALKDRATGETRIFGAVPTYGAFGPIIGLPRMATEFYGGSSQFHDTLFAWDAPSFTFTTGHGVEPDVVVRQKQSDVFRNVDTMIEAARAWLLGGGS